MERPISFSKDPVIRDQEIRAFSLHLAIGSMSTLGRVSATPLTIAQEYVDYIKGRDLLSSLEEKAGEKKAPSAEADDAGPVGGDPAGEGNTGSPAIGTGNTPASLRQGSKT